MTGFFVGLLVGANIGFVIGVIYRSGKAEQQKTDDIVAWLKEHPEERIM